MEKRITFCRICEPLCGLSVTVDGDRVVAIRPDRDHPLSRGFACPKGIAMAEVQNDPDRVLHPLRRGSGGRFERVTWEEALDDIGRRLRTIIREYGGPAVGWYMGNPAAFSFAHPVWLKGFVEAIGSPHLYTAGSQDINSRLAASALLYGSPVLVPFPDLRRTSFLLMVGANPLVSQGSAVAAPRVREQLRGIVARGGRVVVVDPRRTETARAFEHLPIRPDTDAWLLLSLLHVVFADGLEDSAAIERLATGAGALRAAVADLTPEVTEPRTGVPAAVVRRLAHDLATAPSAAVYGRTGSCLGRFGTLVCFLLDSLSAGTGNLDVPGGSVVGRPPIPYVELGHRLGLTSYATRRSRLGGLPDVLGSMPAALMAREMADESPERIRAFFVSAGNPVLSVPDGDALERALEGLDLCVSLDIYVNETNRHAHYVLPATTFLERADLPVASLPLYTTPFAQYTEAVVPPAGEAREEWWIIDQIARRVGVVPSGVRAIRLLGRLGIHVSPLRAVDVLLRLGPSGDLFGLRPSGLSLAKLRRHPHGVVLGEHVATGVLSRRIRHGDRRVHLYPPEIADEMERLRGSSDLDAEYPLRLIGMREARSHNSWMHNAPTLMRGRPPQTLRVHPEDARRCGVDGAGRARLVSRSGAVEVPVTHTDEMTPGTVALPHGWGHAAGQSLAARMPGVNVNLLCGSGPESLERLAGMSFLNGVPVRLEPVDRS